MMTTGAGDLVGCDLDDHLDNPTRNVVTRSGFLVKALTYCEMKAIQLDHVLEVCMHWHVIQLKCGLMDYIVRSLLFADVQTLPGVAGHRSQLEDQE